jgi:CRISPR system Cascade subunit CasC
MSSPRFIQIHSLTSYPASLLNRDDVGFAKRIPFGGSVRTRISSQCLKRHWRTFDGDASLRTIPDTEMSVRSRRTFDKFVFSPLVEAGIDEATARDCTTALMAEVLGKSAKAKKEEAKSGEPAALETGQITVLGRPELDYLYHEALEVCRATGSKGVDEALKKHFTKERKANLRTLRVGSGLDAALFGRMVTSDILARCDAALHVAHAFTVHAEATESDYFSAVDDLLASGDDSELGSGHIGTTELTTGLFYGYVVIDVQKLVENLSEDRQLAAEVVDRVIRLVATVSPGAKLGSTAPHAYAGTMIVEVGDAQPRTLANAFLRPVRERPDLLVNAGEALASHIAGLDGMYGAVDRRYATIDADAGLSRLAERLPTLAGLATWAKSAVQAA